MDKQTEKNKVFEAEKLLQELLDQNSITLKEIQELSKKLQKVNSDAQKKKEENQKALDDYISNKPKIKEYLSQNELNLVILGKASQKILSKNQPKTNQDKEDNNNNVKAQKCPFKLENKNLAEIYVKEGEKYFKENIDDLFIYFETLTKDKLEVNEIPFYTMAFFPKEKKVIFYFQNKGKIDLSFSQVDYLCDSGSNIFLNIDYFSMIENCDIEKGREYKKNILDNEKVEKFIKEMPLFKDNELTIVYMENDEKKFKKEFCEFCQILKEKIKGVITNNKDYFNELFI
jgi:hypothetical protein